MSGKAYVVGTLGDDGFHIDRIYLDRTEAERFIEAHNAVDYNYSIEEYPIGAPAVEYDGPRWNAEWIDGYPVNPSAPPGSRYWFEPFWSNEKLNIRSEWHTGDALPDAELRVHRGAVLAARVHGSSKERVEKVLQDAINQIKAEQAGLA